MSTPAVYNAAVAALPSNTRLLKAGESIQNTDLTWALDYVSWNPCNFSMSRLFADNVGLYARASDSEHPPEGHVLRPAAECAERDDLVWAWGVGPWRRPTDVEWAQGVREGHVGGFKDTYSRNPVAKRLAPSVSATQPPAGYRLVQQGELMKNDDLMWNVWGPDYKAPAVWAVHSLKCPGVRLDDVKFTSHHAPRARLIEASLPCTTKPVCGAGPKVAVRTSPLPLPVGFYALPLKAVIQKGDKYFSKELSCWCDCVTSVGQHVTPAMRGWYVRPLVENVVQGLARSWACPTTAERAARRGVTLPPNSRWLERGERIAAGDLEWWGWRAEWRVSNDRKIGQLVQGILRARPLSVTKPPLVLPPGFRLVAWHEDVKPGNQVLHEDKWLLVMNAKNVNDGRRLGTLKHPYITFVQPVGVPHGYRIVQPSEDVKFGDRVSDTRGALWKPVDVPANLNDGTRAKFEATGSFYITPVRLGGTSVVAEHAPAKAPAPLWPAMFEYSYHGNSIPEHQRELAVFNEDGSGMVVRSHMGYERSFPVGRVYPKGAPSSPSGANARPIHQWKRRDDLRSIWMVLDGK